MSSVYDEPPKRGKSSKAVKKRKSDVTGVCVPQSESSNTEVTGDSDDDGQSKRKKSKAEPVG